MSGAPWVRFFPSDWLAGTRGMSAAETGVYITLIAMMYESKEPVQDDDARLSRLCGLPVPGYRKIRDSLISSGKIVSSDGHLWNKRAQTEMEIRDEKTVSAKKSADSRWSKKQVKSIDDGCERNANAMRTQCYPEPDIRKEELDAYASCPVEHKNPDLFEAGQLAPIAKPAAQQQGDHERFVEFWQTYPKRLGTNSRKEASAKFSRAVRAGADPSEIINGAARYAAHCDETGKTSTDKVQQATTWLNQQNWETDYGRQQRNQRQQNNGTAAKGNATIANVFDYFEDRRNRFTDPVTGAFDERAADIADREDMDRRFAEFFPATFGRVSR